MKFSSLKQFKDAIIEHSILNRRQLRFEKNDTLRVKVRCKETCEFMAYCSKVGRTHTYRLKTLIEKYTCGEYLITKIPGQTGLQLLWWTNSIAHQR